MCQICVDAMHKYFPNISDDDMGTFLMEKTCFPFGSAEMVELQLKELKEKGSIEGALESLQEEKP